MIVRVKRSVGVYGHVENGVIAPLRYSDGPFEVAAEKGKELAARGIVDVVEEETATAAAPATETPEPEETALDDMTRTELLDLAEKRGLEVSKRAKKEDILEVLKGSAE